jgi:hypothetical protein
MKLGLEDHSHSFEHKLHDLKVIHELQYLTYWPASTNAQCASRNSRNSMATLAYCLRSFEHSGQQTLLTLVPEKMGNAHNKSYAYCDTGCHRQNALGHTLLYLVLTTLFNIKNSCTLLTVCRLLTQFKE